MIIKNKIICNKAYTLIELATVLIIIAFIISGIISASAISTQAQIRSIITDAMNYKKIIKTFEEKYGALPGDIKASNIWSGAIDGNEDSRIGNGNANAADITTEPTYVWQHLALANLFTMPPNSNGVNFPASNLAGTNFFAYDQNVSSNMYNRIGTYIGLSKFTTTVPSTALPWNSGVSRPIATAIDIKIDDGIPSSGMFYVARGDDNSSNNVCVSGYWSSVTSATYTFTDTDVTCRIIFWLKELT